jgi:hypothetical protein
LQRSVHDVRSSGFAESAQYVIRRDVPDDVAAEADAATLAVTKSATTSARMRPGYCHGS